MRTRDAQWPKKTKMFNPMIFISSVKFINSEKATKLCEIFILLLTDTTWDKSKVKISQNFVAFSEYMNFTTKNLHKTSKAEEYLCR